MSPFKRLRYGDEWAEYEYRGYEFKYVGVGASGYYDGGIYLGRTEEEVREKIDSWPERTPSDDDEPITREWMREEYGDTRVVVGLFTVALNVRRATISVVCGACKNVVVRSVPAKTRRQLRDLLAALGYRREEG